MLPPHVDDWTGITRNLQGCSLACCRKLLDALLHLIGVTGTLGIHTAPDVRAEVHGSYDRWH